MITELSIYDCGEIISRIEAEAEKNGGELSEEQWGQLIEAQTTSIAKLEKLINYTCLLEKFCENVDSELTRLQERKKIEKNRIESIKGYLLPLVEAKGSMLVGTHRLSTRKSEKIVVDEDFDNPLYMRVIPESKEPDKPKIKESIKSGIEVQGARLEQKKTVQIK